MTVASRVRLGLQANWQQFTLLVIINAFVGAMVGVEGQAIGVDMTPAMLARAQQSAGTMRLTYVEFREGYVEQLPAPDGWADVIISNGVLNLAPDKGSALREFQRVLKPTGRLQIVDTRSVVQTAVPEDGKHDIAVWAG